MTRAFASVAQKGVAVTPFGITRVTANGEVIYQHEVDTSRVLVAAHVAAQMTDLLQTAVNTGSGRAAQIGRPVAGKTGTTSSNKDGWFLGFSSGLTTGVWMGRDDAKAIAGLQGGTAPARAFAAFMKRAVAGRPVEQFETQVTLPEWMDNETSYFGEPDDGVFVDPNGMPLPPGGETFGDLPEPAEDADRLDQDWIDRMTGKDAPDEDPPVREVPRQAPDTPRSNPAQPRPLPAGPRQQPIPAPDRQPQRDSGQE
jgi:penicillin-binding protein 1A